MNDVQGQDRENCTLGRLVSLHGPTPLGGRGADYTGHIAYGCGDRWAVKIGAKMRCRASETGRRIETDNERRAQGWGTNRGNGTWGGRAMRTGGRSPRGPCRPSTSTRARTSSRARPRRRRTRACPRTCCSRSASAAAAAGTARARTARARTARPCPRRARAAPAPAAGARSPGRRCRRSPARTGAAASRLADAIAVSGVSRVHKREGAAPCFRASAAQTRARSHATGAPAAAARAHGPSSSRFCP